MPTEPNRIPDKTLAEHWGMTPSGVSKLRRRKAMPGFTTLAAADAWRAENVGSSRAVSRGSSAKNASPREERMPPLELTGDFLTDARNQAERLHSLAWEALSGAVAAGDDNLVAVRSRTFGEAVKQASAARDRWLEQQARERSLIDVDEARFALGSVLQPLRSALVKMPRQFAALEWSTETATENLRTIAGKILQKVEASPGTLDRMLETPLEEADGD